MSAQHFCFSDDGELSVCSETDIVNLGAPIQVGGEKEAKVFVCVYSFYIFIICIVLCSPVNCWIAKNFKYFAALTLTGEKLSENKSEATPRLK